jgi:hypothetical protein
MTVEQRAATTETAGTAIEATPAAGAAGTEAGTGRAPTATSAAGARVGAAVGMGVGAKHSLVQRPDAHDRTANASPLRAAAG